MSSSEERREVWDRVYRDASAGRSSGDRWLERWTDILQGSRHLPVLELGCGSGWDSRYIWDLGLNVLATDFSEEALRLTGINAPGAETRLVDISRPLPFSDSSFGVVVAGLSLHYFPWKDTMEIVSEIRRVLAPGGHLLTRFNSVNDRFHASAAREEIEADYYLIGGLPRRLFDRKSIEALFGQGWRIENIEELTTGRFGKEKMLWEVVAKKRD